MIITESQLRLVIRQELLEVLRENDAYLLEEGIKEKAKAFITKIGLPLAIIGSMATATGAGVYGAKQADQNAIQSVKDAVDQLEQRKEATSYYDEKSGFTFDRQTGIVTTNEGKTIDLNHLINLPEEQKQQAIRSAVGSGVNEILALSAFMALFAVGVGYAAASEMNPNTNRGR